MTKVETNEKYSSQQKKTLAATGVAARFLGTVVATKKSVRFLNKHLKTHIAYFAQEDSVLE